MPFSGTQMRACSSAAHASGKVLGMALDSEEKDKVNMCTISLGYV